MLEPSVIAAQMPILTSSSRVKLLPLTMRPEGKEYLVSVPEQDLDFAIPPIGVDILQLLDQGLNIAEITQRLAESSHHPAQGVDLFTTPSPAPGKSSDGDDNNDDDDDYDVADFVQNLLDAGVVAAIDDIPIALPPRVQRSGSIELFPRLDGRYLRWIISPVVVCVDIALFLLAAVLLWFFPAYRPSSQNFFVHPWYALNTLIILVTALPLVFVHEFGHLCAARAEGVNGRLSLGRRLYTIVTQFQVENIWQISRRQRIAIYLAGMQMNLRIFALALIILVWRGSTLPHGLAAWLGLVMILELTATLWQFQFFMKTDVYFLVADLFGAPSLMEDARAYISHLGLRLVGRRRGVQNPRQAIPNAIRLYAIVYVAGIALASFTFFVYALPFAIRTIGGSLQVLSSGPTVGVARFSDAIVALLIYSVNLGLLLWFSLSGLLRSSTSRRNA